MTRAAPTRDAIVQLLQHYADGLTKDEIAAELGMHPRAIESCLHYERQKNGSTNFRIAMFKPVRGKGGRPQAVYVIGPGEDARRPDLNTVNNKRERQARYRNSHRARINARLRVMRGRVKDSNPFAQLIRLSQQSASKTQQAKA